MRLGLTVHCLHVGSRSHATQHDDTSAPGNALMTGAPPPQNPGVTVMLPHVAGASVAAPAKLTVVAVAKTTAASMVPVRAAAVGNVCMSMCVCVCVCVCLLDGGSVACSRGRCLPS